MPTQLLDVRATAAALRVHRNTVYRLVAADAVPYYRTSPRGRIRLDLDEVRAALRTA